MKRVLLLPILLLFCVSGFAKEVVQPPVAKKIPRELKIHGDTLVDNFFWLRERDNPEVKTYLQAENEYADSILQPLAPFQESLYKEMLSHIKETDLSVPYREGNYFYYSRTEQGKQYEMYCRKKGSMDAPEEILLDVNALAEGLPYLGIGAVEVSNDGNLLAYATDTTGYREYTVKIKDLRTGHVLPDQITKVSYSLAWAADNRTLFYSTIDPAKRPYRISRHVLGSEKDQIVYEDKNEKYYVSAYQTRDKKYMLISSNSTTMSEIHYVPADHPDQKPTLILPRQTDHEYSVDHRDGLFYILTNKDAKNFRLVSAPVKTPQPENWKELIPHRKDVLLEDVDLFENHCVVSERATALEYLNVIDLRTAAAHRIEMPEPVYSINSTGNAEYKTNVLRFGYQSMITPNTVFDYDMDSKKRTRLKQQEVPGYDPSQYATERTWATATDGVKVPVSIVYKKGVQRNGSAPLLLNGYGAYGSSYSVSFSAASLVLLDRGMVIAIAHIRGGGDMGKEWYEQGRMFHKINTFTDFIAAAEHLVAQKYTSREKLVATGGSAGGLLMGAVTNMRPDLFHVILNYVPYVDVINTMLDPTIPLVVPEYEEWGNPQNQKDYVYMKSYCPYTNIGPKNYPAILVRASFWDSQVPYWEAAKYVAKMRSLKTDKRLLLLKTALQTGGHGGRSGRYDSLRDDAFDYAFMFDQLGIPK